MIGWLTGTGLASELLGQVADAVRGWWGSKQQAARHRREAKAAERQAEAEAREAEARAEKAKAKARGRWAAKAVARSSPAMRWASFAQWAAGFWGMLLFPEHGAQAVQVAQQAPAWLTGGYAAITGAIWGIPTMRQAFRL